MGAVRGTDAQRASLQGLDLFMKLVYGFRVHFFPWVTLANLRKVIDSPDGIVRAEDVEGNHTLQLPLERVPVAAPGWGPPDAEFEEWYRLSPPTPAERLVHWRAPGIVESVDLLLHPEGDETYNILARSFTE